MQPYLLLARQPPSWRATIHPSIQPCAQTASCSQALSQAHRQGREQQSASPRQPPEASSTVGQWLSFSPGVSPRCYLAITSGSCLSTKSCMLWCSVDLSRKRRKDRRYLSGSATKLLMGDAMLGVRRGQAAPCSSSLRAREGMKSAGEENPAHTRTLLHVPGPAAVPECCTILQ